MASEPEKPRVTEIKVRMDCNGCVQKIKKALHGIVGICQLYIDFPQQKVTIVGWADPEKIIKAIKKTRKSAVICLHTEQSDQSDQPTSELPTEGDNSEGGAPPHETTHQVAEPQQAEAAPSQEPPKEPSPQENPPEPNPESVKATSNQPTQPSILKEGEEIHVIYHYPPDYGPWAHPRVPRFRGEPVQQPETPEPYSGPWSHPGAPRFRGELSRPPESQVPYSGPWANPGVPRFQGEPPQPVQPVSVSHSYNTYKPSPYVTEYAHPRPPPPSYYPHYSGPSNSGPETREYSYNTYKPSPYITEYAYPRSPPNFYQHYNSPSQQSYYSPYTRQDNFNQEYYNGNHGNGNVTSIFSEENPNACTIV